MQSKTVDPRLCALVGCSSPNTIQPYKLCKARQWIPDCVHCWAVALTNTIQPYKLCKAIQWIPDCVHWWVVALTLYSPTSYAKQYNGSRIVCTGGL